METRKGTWHTLFISLALFVVGVILTSPSVFGLCKAGDTYCFDPYDEMIGQPVAMFSVVLFVLSLLFFALPKTFRSWLRFAKYYLPIAALLVILSPVSDSSIFGFDKEFMSWLLAGTFFILSTLLIAYKWFRGRGK